MGIRVRFAPSPTGPVSIGNIRTALYNWLYARHTGGEFLLRIEDTDTERSEARYETEVLEGLRWLGLEWDGPIVRQSERTEVYERYLRKLIEQDRAYLCFCTKEELDADYAAQLSQGLVPKYGGRCRTLAVAEAARRHAASNPAVIRLRMPNAIFTFTDLIRGRVSFDAALTGDIIIAKGFRAPLYNFAAVVDDYESSISTVIRGEDHISNTPKQLAIHQALDLPHPAYAHLPLILGPDRKKLSKRFLSGSLMDYRRAGYLPEAMRNFLALLGWHPVHDEELLDLDALVSEFSLERVQKGGAVFNPEKLEWMNGVYLRTLSVEALMEYLVPLTPPAWQADREFLYRVVAVERERLKRLGEFTERASFYFTLPSYDPALLVWKQTPIAAIRENLAAVREALRSIPRATFTRTAVDAALEPVVAARGRGEVLWPFRVALTGQGASPGPLELAEVFGADETMRRLSAALDRIHA